MFFLFLVVFWVVLGLELRAFTLSHSTSSDFFVFFKIGAYKLVAQAGFKL
jgi:hypothetical protein